MRYKNFEIRKPTFLGEPPTKDYCKYNFDLVKWNADNTACWSRGTLTYNKREGAFEFKSVGTRYLRERTDGLETFLLRWCDLQTVIIMGDEDE